MSSSSLKKLPPNVLRELRRHVNPQPISKKSHEVLLKELHEERNSKMKYVFRATVLFTGTMCAVPLVIHYYMSGLNSKETPLTAAQVRRGAFLNSGTKDVGVDPDWDFNIGKYKKDTGYYAMYQQEHENDNNQSNDNKPASSGLRGGEYYAMPATEMDKHEANLREFAAGKRKQNGEKTNYKG